MTKSPPKIFTTCRIPPADLKHGQPLMYSKGEISSTLQHIAVKEQCRSYNVIIITYV